MNIIELRNYLNKIIEAEDTDMESPIKLCHNDVNMEINSLQINIGYEVVPLRIILHETDKS